MKISRKKNAARSIAVVADNNNRTQLIEWSYFNKDLLNQHDIVSMGEAVSVLEGTLNRSIDSLFTKETGGYAQLIKLAEAGSIDTIFVFAGDDASQYDAELEHLLLVAARNNILLACNRVTTRLVMDSLHPSTEDVYPGILQQAMTFVHGLGRRLRVAAI